jgi:Fe-S-cluster containining protein
LKYGKIRVPSTASIAPGKVDMRCNNCGKCCEETEMELASSDIQRLERLGLRRGAFAIECKDGWTRLRNVDGRCCFYDTSRKRCRIYMDRPKGCRIYPVIYSEEEGFKIDELCPKSETISEKELAIKRRALTRFLRRLESETSVPIRWNSSRNRKR